jgi:hypothetical protein
MKSRMNSTLISLALLLTMDVGAVFAELGSGANWTIAISPNLSGDSRQRISGKLFEFVLSAPAGSTFEIVDAVALNRIASFQIPQEEVYGSPRLRAQKLDNDLSKVKEFFAKGSQALPRLLNAVKLPQLLTLVGERRRGSEQRLLVVGSPLYIDEEEDVFSMDSGYFPSDGHMMLPGDQSVFSTVGRESLLAGVRVYFALVEPAWRNHSHENRVKRFWSLYISREGGALISFAADPVVVFEQTLDASLPPLAIDPPAFDSNAKPEMIALSNTRMVEDWLSRDTVAAASPPNSVLGSLDIGIRWSCRECDLDLYSAPEPGSKELSYMQTSSGMGRHIKDFTESPTPVAGYETVEFSSPVDVRRATAAVNLYAGNAPNGAEGELRVRFNGHVYTRPFRIAATSGNRGRDDGNRGASPSWVVFDLSEIVGLTASTMEADPTAARILPLQYRSEMPASGFRPVSRSTSHETQGSDGSIASSTPELAVRIESPRDGELIVARSGEPVPVRRPMSGDVLGLTGADLQRELLVVRITIVTDAAYPQGSAVVDRVGRWTLPAVNYGGDVHQVLAELMDRNGSVLASTRTQVRVAHARG